MHLNWPFLIENPLTVKLAQLSAPGGRLQARRHDAVQTDKFDPLHGNTICNTCLVQ